MADADDRAGRRLGRRRCTCTASATASCTGSSPSTGHSHGDSPISAGAVTGATVACMVIGVAVAWAQYGRRPVPAVAPRGSLLTRAARRDLLQDDFDHVVLVRSRSAPSTLVYVDHTLVDGVVNGTAASVGGLFQADPQTAERLRALVRGLDVRRCGTPRRRDPADEGGLIPMSFPLLTVTAACRPSGRSPRQPCRPRNAPRPSGWRCLWSRWPALGLAVAVLVRFDPDGDRYQLAEFQCLDRGLRRPVRTGRGRHRGGADRARPADPVHHPRGLARRRPAGDRQQPVAADAGLPP
ncbi:hypothetical protein SVIOM342S_03230 [Streptomyces violaceorubidus]